MPRNPESPRYAERIAELKAAVLACLADGPDTRLSLMRRVGCGCPHDIGRALAELGDEGRIGYRLVSTAGRGQGPRQYWRVGAVAPTVREPDPVAHLRRGKFYGGCACGCTERVVGYHTDPINSYNSGPVLGCGRAAA